jgi:choline dehydrogenase-like flavoprotein
MTVDDNEYDWIVVGGGISGITTAEILCRGGKSVLLLEKNKELSSETSKVFHEWLHSGSLYSLAPDKLITLRYLLGATDDLFEYYNSFSGMNLEPTESGIDVNVNVDGAGWFNDEHIEYRYRKHMFNPIWSSLVSRSINVIDLLN